MNEKNIEVLFIYTYALQKDTFVSNIIIENDEARVIILQKVFWRTIVF